MTPSPLAGLAPPLALPFWATPLAWLIENPGERGTRTGRTAKWLSSCPMSKRAAVQRSPRINVQPDQLLGWVRAANAGDLSITTRRADDPDTDGAVPHADRDQQIWSFGSAGKLPMPVCELPSCDRAESAGDRRILIETARVTARREVAHEYLCL